MDHRFPRTLFLGLVNFICALSLAQEPAPALIGYWQNWNDANAPYIELDQIDPRYNVIEVAFAEPAAGSTFDMQFTPSMTAPATFIAQVEAHQALGHTVLISIGGANATVQLNSDADRDQFVLSMMGILTTYGFDGIDLDLEGSSVSITGGSIATPVDAGILRLIDAVEEIMVQYHALTGEKLFLTMAPETAFVQGGMSAFGGIWGAYLPVIHALRNSLDILQVQLYNSGSMYGIDGGTYTQGTADFIVSQTEAVIQGFSTGGGIFEGLSPEKVAVALPACTNAAGGGYTDTATVGAAMRYLLGEGPQPGSYTLAQPGGYPTLRGMMTWSINWDAASACDGLYSYTENFERIFGDASTGVPATDACLLHVWPNPCTGLVSVSWPAAGRVVIRWSDALGRVLRSGTRPTAERWVLDVSDLPDGPLVLTIRSDGQELRRSVMKQ